MHMPGSDEHLPLTLETFLYAALEPKQDHWSSHRWVVHGLLVPPRLRCPCAPVVEVLSITCMCPWHVWFIPIVSAFIIFLACWKAHPWLGRSRACFCGRDGSRCLFLLMTSSRKHSAILISEGSKISDFFFLLLGFSPCRRKKHWPQPLCTLFFPVARLQLSKRAKFPRMLTNNFDATIF